MEPQVNLAVVRAQLNQVLDPELDESILDLGFVESVEVTGGRVDVTLRLPTFWCAANFAYMMAEDIRYRLLQIPGISQVVVHLRDHFASQAIESGVNAGRSFVEAFPTEATENLEGLRAFFLRKGFLRRQERLLRQLLEAGVPVETACTLRVGDVGVRGDSGWVQVGHTLVRLYPVKPLLRYLERRRELGLDVSPEAPLLTDLGGQPLSPERIHSYLQFIRTVRVSLEANAFVCCALLERRTQGLP